jgi:hypothetical protein
VLARTVNMRGFPLPVCVVIVGVVSGLAVVREARAAPVRGTIQLPGELKTGRRLRGYWRFENGIVPIAPAANRSETVVVLSGVKGQSPAARTVTVDINGYQALPWTVVVGEGSVVEFKNSDRVPHDLSLPDLPTLMPLERLAPGALRRQRFLTAGGYAVRDSEHPHLVISVLVVGGPYYDLADERGGFRIADAPDGKATLKVWSGGRWVHEQEIEVGPKSDGLQIRVAGGAGKPAAE